jgi:hypothetical protein
MKNKELIIKQKKQLKFFQETYDKKSENKNKSVKELRRRNTRDWLY